MIKNRFKSKRDRIVHLVEMRLRAEEVREELRIDSIELEEKIKQLTFKKAEVDEELESLSEHIYNIMEKIDVIWAEK